MQILYLTEEQISFSEAQVRGGAIHVKKVVEGLRDRGHDVFLLDWNSTPEREFQTSVSPRMRFVDGALQTAHRAKRVGEKVDVDVIISKTRKTYLPGLVAATRLGVPHVVHVGSTLDAPGNWRRRFDTLSMSLRLRTPHDAYFVVCEYITAQLRARDIPESLIYNVRNAVDAERFASDGARAASDRLRRALERPSADLLVGFVGGLHEYKGVYDLAAAVERCESNVHVLVAGDGPERRPLQSRLGENATFLGSVPYEEMPAVYDAMDAFVLPSHTEGLPRTVLEAQASGTPVIATRVGGVPEVIENGVTGLLAPSNDARTIAEHMETLASNTDRRRSLGEAGQAAVLEAFDWDALYDRYETFLDAVV